MKRKWVRQALVVLIIFQFVLCVPVRAEGYSDYLDSIMDMARERYYKEISTEELLKGALKGIFETMDEYTTFYELDEATTFLNTLEGNYQGIGVEIMQVPEGVMVTRVFASSPAEGAGIIPNDIIIRVDGQDIAGMTATEVSNLIKGEEGTIVELGILRGYSGETLNINVQRGTINVSPVTWRVDGDVMYIRLDSFSGNSARFFEQALKEMDKRNLWKMVLDLRDNPGGDVFQAVSIARLLVREGLITTLDFKSEKQNDIEYWSYLKKEKYLPAVLVNGNTASASEILASAIMQSESGFLVGTKTFGKGVVQNILPILSPEAYERYKEEYGLSNVDAADWINQYRVNVSESELIGWTKITTGHYLTRNGDQIHGIGLEPNFVVDNEEMLYGIDVQAIKSLESPDDIKLNGVSNDVFNAEKILCLAGYITDVPDNKLDESTVEALKLYQGKKGIQVTGILDKATKDALNKDLENLRFSLDKQYAKARQLLALLKN